MVHIHLALNCRLSSRIFSDLISKKISQIWVQPSHLSNINVIRCPIYFEENGHGMGGKHSESPGRVLRESTLWAFPKILYSFSPSFLVIHVPPWHVVQICRVSFFNLLSFTLQDTVNNRAISLLFFYISFCLGCLVFLVLQVIPSS